MSEFSNRLDELLFSKHLRRADLSRGTGIPDSTIRGWNDRIPSVEAAYKVAQFLEITVEELLTGKNNNDINTLDSEDRELLRYYHIMDARDKLDLMDIARNKAYRYKIASLGIVADSGSVTNSNS